MILTQTLSAVASPVQLKAKSPTDFVELTETINQQPYWRKKTLWESMIKDRKIPVSVTHDPNWSFKGAGIVQVPRMYALESAKEFNRLSQIPEYMPEVKFDAEKSILHLKVIFLNKARPLDLELFEEFRDQEARIYFRSLGPWLKGMQGAVAFKDHERQATEVGMIAQYAGDVGWIPNWLFSVASEAVMHHAAEQLRKSLESDYKK